MLDSTGSRLPGQTLGRRVDRWRRRQPRVAAAMTVTCLALVACAAGSPLSTSGSASTATDPAATRWHVLAPSPLSARTGVATIWTGTEAIVFGGYDPNIDSVGVAEGIPRPTTTLAGTTGTVVGSGRDINPAPKPNRPTSAKVDGAAYNPATDTWRLLAPAPIPGELSVTSATSVGGRLTIFFGGTTCSIDDRSPEPAGAWYDVATDQWQPIPASPLGLWCAPAGAWLDAKLWVFSGKGGAVYDPSARTWESVSAPSDIGVDGRDLHSAAGRLITMSRGNDFERWEPSARSFDPATRQWSQLPPPPVVVESSVSSGDRIYGWDGSAAQAAVFDAKAGTWSRLADAPISTRYGNATALVGDRLVVWGGYERSRREGPMSGFEAISPGAALNDGAVFDPRTGAWSTIAAAPIAGRANPGAIASLDSLIVWGGEQIEKTDLGRRTVVRPDGGELRPA